MTRKRAILLAAITGLAALAIAVPWSTVTGKDHGDDGPAGLCKPGGVYLGKDAGGATWSQTIVPCDPAGNRMTTIAKFANISPVFSMGPGVLPWFPTTEYRTDFIGDLIRTGRNTWDFTWIGYGVEKPEDPPTYPGYAWPLTYIMVGNGTQTFSDCGDHVTLNFRSVKIWEVDVQSGIDPDVNPADGYPDEGVEPTFSLLPPGAVYTETATRAPVVPQ